MDTERIRELLTELGIDPQKIPLLLELVKELGGSIDVSEGAYIPKVKKMRTEIVGTRWKGWKVLLVLVILGLVLGLVIWFLAP